MPLRRIAVLGLGKVGTLAAKLLHAGGFDVVGFDSRAPHQPLPFAVQVVSVETDDGAGAATQGFDAVLSCLPYRINKRIAAAAHARRDPLFRSDRGRPDDSGDHRSRARARGSDGAAMRRSRRASSASSAPRRSPRSKSAGRCGCASARFRRIRPVSWAMRSTGRPRASSTNT